MTDLLPGAKYVQLVEWGYPPGSLRPAPPPAKAFSTIHITGNSRLPTAEGEAAWRKNDPGLQNSATFFVNRDGTVVQTLGDPLRMDPWANGDVKSPDTANPRIAAMVRDGVNANERTLVAIENVGYEPGYPITAAQEGTCARIIAHYHAKASVPISRLTVIGHYQLNSVSRPNCPGVDKRVIDRIVAKAQALVAPAPLPDAPQEDDMIDPAKHIPAGLADVGQVTVWADPDRTARIPGLEAWSGTDIELYWTIAPPFSSPTPLVPIRLNMNGPGKPPLWKVGWVGADKVTVKATVAGDCAAEEAQAAKEATARTNQGWQAWLATHP